MNVGKSIQTIRELNNFSQTFVAQQLGISQKTYSTLEKSENDISVSTLLKLSKLYNVSLNKILELNAEVILNSSNNHVGTVYFNNHGTYHNDDVTMFKEIIQSQMKQIEVLNNLLSEDKQKKL